VVSLLFNYYTPEEQEDPQAPKISKYAYGEDYHFIIKDKLKSFMNEIHQEIGEVNGRVFVDSAPVLDKAWAKKSGLGWMGKNTNIIHPKEGSFFFIAEIILDLELEYDGPIKDYCGTCTKCIDACPTGAIKPYEVDGSKCISYLTIELKDEIIPKEFSGKMENWMFGCDICQDVCPWNRFAKKHNEPKLNPHDNLLKMSKVDWEDLTEEVFRELFKKSAVKRTKFKGLKRNISFLK
jgi:epoxyqueuosine reductase